MSFPRYPEYKESGVAWLGDVPAHWGVQQGRRLYWQKRDSALPGDEQLSATQKYGVVPQCLFMEMEDQKVTLALSGLDNFKHVEVDDFVISLRSFQGGIERSKYSGCVSPAYTVLRPAIPVDACYMGYVLKSSGYIAALQSVTDGIRDGKNISYEQFGQIGVPCPRHAEQTAIAAFLDRETTKIDALVAEQEKLIALLKEKRQAVISHAVTKGLDPDVPMKDSGIEWLGAVPAHWTVSQLRYVVQPGTSITYGIVQAGPEFEGGVPYIRTSDMSGDALPIDGYPRTSPEIDASYARSRVSVGDLVIAIRASVGKCLLVPPELHGANLTQGTAKICPSEKTTSGFMLPFINSHAVQTYLDSKAKGATFKEITLETLRKTPFLVPPADEQTMIARWVREKGQEFNALITAAEQAQVLLKERRSALIAAAVTGKIDVRSAVTLEAAA